MPDSNTDGAVVLDDRWMEGFGEGGEELINMFPIVAELGGTVWEDDEGSFDELAPRNDPLSVCVNRFSRLGPADDEFKLANMFGPLLVMVDGVGPRKDLVEVNGSSVE